MNWYSCLFWSSFYVTICLTDKPTTNTLWILINAQRIVYSDKLSLNLQQHRTHNYKTLFVLAPFHSNNHSRRSPNIGNRIKYGQDPAVVVVVRSCFQLWKLYALIHAHNMTHTQHLKHDTDSINNKLANQVLWTGRAWVRSYSFSTRWTQTKYVLTKVMMNHRQLFSANSHDVNMVRVVKQ